MLNIIFDIPKQFKIGYNAGKNQLKAKNYKLKVKHIIICGMGGSALAGDILKMWIENRKIEKQRNKQTKIVIHKDYDLPQNINKKNTLVICVSYSGNTEETVSSYQTAIKSKIPTLALTNEGGKLLELCKKNKTPVVLINVKNIPPRLALASQFSALLAVFENLGIIKNTNKEIISLSKINALKKKNFAKKLAESLKDKIPVIYSSKNSEALAYNLKINLNETSKSPAFYNLLPEMNHNEIVGFDKSSKISKKLFEGILLKSKNDRPKITKRMQLLKKLIPQIKFHNINIGDNGYLIDIFNAIIFFNLTSYYLAQKYKVDPIKTEVIERLKKEMA